METVGLKKKARTVPRNGNGWRRPNDFQEGSGNDSENEPIGRWEIGGNLAKD